MFEYLFFQSRSEEKISPGRDKGLRDPGERPGGRSRSESRQKERVVRVFSVFSAGLKKAGSLIFKEKFSFLARARRLF